MVLPQLVVPCLLIPQGGLTPSEWRQRRSGWGEEYVEVGEEAGGEGRKETERRRNSNH